MGDIRATPRNRLMGLLADWSQGASDFAGKPFGYDNPPANALMGLLSVPAINNTLNEMSYGGALGTGTGMTWRPKPDTVDAAMAALPLGATAGKAAIEGGAKLAQKAEPAIDRYIVRSISNNGGVAPQWMQDLTQGTRSNMIDFPSDFGRPQKSNAIKSLADDFAGKLNSNGFQAQVEHSGSAMGPSSYVRVYDPQTGRYFVDPVRFSDHSKGAIQSQLVNEVRGNFDATDAGRFLQMADDMRARGATEFMKLQQQRQAIALARKLQEK